MQVLIFGATGSLGLHLVKNALDQGFAVKAFTRHPAKLEKIQNDHLRVIRGDVFQLSDVLKAMENVDAVLCCLGDGAKGKVRAQGTQNIVQAMENSGVKRFICQSTLGLGESWQNLNFFWKRIMFGFLLKKAFQDHAKQESIIQKSSLDYTLIRPSAFTNEPPSNSYHIAFGPEMKGLRLKISRADLANFMLEQVQSGQYSRQLVSLSS